MKSKGKLATIYMYCKHGSIHIAVAVATAAAAVFFGFVWSHLQHWASWSKWQIHTWFAAVFSMRFVQMQVPICIFCYYFSIVCSVLNKLKVEKART